MKKIEEDVEIKKLDKPIEKPAQGGKSWGVLNVLKKLFGNKNEGEQDE